MKKQEFYSTILDHLYEGILGSNGKDEIILASMVASLISLKNSSLPEPVDLSDLSL